MLFGILNALLAGPKYGLELMDTLKCSARIYPVLRSLERDGFLRSYESNEAAEERGGRPRRYYELTDSGRHLLKITD